MKEERLYPILKEYLEGKGYNPVKITPSIKIRGYRPDVTGLKGKEVQCIEAKPEFNEYRIMEAVTQAKIYMLGATHVFVAFPRPRGKKEEDLLEFLKTLCNDHGIGIYLIDVKSKKVDEILNAKFSKYLCLPDYDNVLQQLEEKEFLVLENTYPEYIRDLCIYLSKEPTKSKTKEELINELEKSFEPGYWLYRSGARRSEQNQYVKNRIEKTIEGAIQLGFIEVKDGNKLELSYNGYLLAQLDNEITSNKPKELNEKQRAFLTAYLLRYPVFKRAVEILSEISGSNFMLFAWSKCKRNGCGYKHWNIKKFEIRDNSLLCPKCREPVEISLLHKMRLEYGIDGYFPIIFTKGVHNKPLDIFEFGKKDRVDAIKLKL